MRILALLILFILLPGGAMAAAFNPPPTDKSVELLGYIFGSSLGPSIHLGGAPNPALRHMFELFNVVVISIGTIIISWIGIISTVNTAQEGKTMGRKGNLWIPMRATVGMLFIVPTPASGYSVIQTSVMWLILQGVGAADVIWNSVLSDLSNGLAINATIEKPKDEEHPVFMALEQEGEILTGKLLRSAVCMLSLRDISTRYANGSSAQRESDIATYGRNIHRYFVDSDTDHITDNQVRFSGTMYVGVRGNEKYSDICGRYNITTTLNKDEWENPRLVNKTILINKAHEIYSHKKQALANMFGSLLAIAEKIVSQDVQPRNEETDNRLRDDPNVTLYPAGFKSFSTGVYVKTLTALVKPQRVEAVQEIVRAGSLNGWIAAGSFYFALNHQPDHLLFFDDVTVVPTSEMIPSCNNPDHCTRLYPAYAHDINDKLRNFIPDHEIDLVSTRLWDADIYFKRDNKSIDESIVRELKRQPGARESDLQRDITRYMAKAISEKSVDPMIAQGKFGSQLMKESEDLWRMPLHEQQELINQLAERDGTMGLIGQELRELINRTTNKGATFMTVYGIVWICGATMAIYIPLIPYMMFTVAALGWFLLVIEAVVAAPILALSFILPTGEELGKIAQGLMLLLNIVLRPTLMLFGFVLASRLYSAIVQLVNFSMLGNFSNLNLHESLFASVAIVCLYVMFILALSNKCFALIYALPDKILRWMGGAPEHTDATQEMQQAKGVMTKGADGINKISTGFGERGFARLQSRAKHANQLDQPNARDRDADQ